MEVVPATAYSWEAEAGKTPRPDALRRLAALLGVTEAWLLFGVEPMAPSGARAMLAAEGRAETYQPGLTTAEAQAHVNEKMRGAAKPAKKASGARRRR